tara:strand:+ start:9220 stop:9654 length:435 start_codon:yes stop_codon:yes gene_type:complete
MNTLVNVTNQPELWSAGDPVRPHLSASFKSSNGREVFGLKDPDGSFLSFICIAYTEGVPSCEKDLETMVVENPNVAVPYTVWSVKRGAGREIVNKAIDFIRDSGKAKKVITLSPLTDMAKSFHLKNKASLIRVNETTANFEYRL